MTIHWLDRTVMDIAAECGISGAPLAKLAGILGSDDLELLKRLTTPIRAMLNGDADQWEREAFDKALRETWQMVDPLNPPSAGTYYRGEHNGIIAALRTIRENFESNRAALTAGKGKEQTASTGSLAFDYAHAVVAKKLRKF